MPDRIVVMVHGIGRTSASFTQMAHVLRAAGYAVADFDYPSTHLPIEECSLYLRSFIESLSAYSTVDIVCQSMGGLVLRSALRDSCKSRIRRVVFLGVPQQGAEIAHFFRNNPLYRYILGPAGQQLVTQSEFIRSLPPPQFEFGTLAGGRSWERGFNPLLPGDNDGTVTVTSTRIEEVAADGEADFILMPTLHSFLMSNKACIKATRQFLDTGRFRTGPEFCGRATPKPSDH